MVTFVVSTDSADTCLHCPDITWLHLWLSSTHLFSCIQPAFFCSLDSHSSGFLLQYTIHIAKQKRVKCSQKRTRRRGDRRAQNTSCLIQPLVSILSGFTKAAVK